MKKVCCDLQVFVIFSVFMLSSCCGKPYVIGSENSVNSNTVTSTVFVSNHGWHTGLIIPAQIIDAKLPTLKKRFGEIPYYEFGWGDAGFYRAKEITFGLSVKAIAWPTDTVVHVVAVSDEPERYFSQSDIFEIHVEHAKLEGLIEYILASFKKDDDGMIIPLEKGIYGDSNFYHAEGKYYLMNTCNKWTAKGLKSIGMDISVVFKLTADSVTDYLRRENYTQIAPVQEMVPEPLY